MSKKIYSNIKPIGVVAVVIYSILMILALFAGEQRGTIIEGCVYALLVYVSIDYFIGNLRKIYYTKYKILFIYKSSIFPWRNCFFIVNINAIKNISYSRFLSRLTIKSNVQIVIPLKFTNQLTEFQNFIDFLQISHEIQNVEYLIYDLELLRHNFSNNKHNNE